MLALATFVLQPPAEFRDRSFFGVTEVLESPNGELTLLMNGTTVHGSQSNDPAQARARRRATTSAAARSATSSRSTRAGPGRRGRSASPVSVAAPSPTYADQATSMTFFEIDPVVIQVASDPRYFTYLADAPTRPTIVEGDARLSFEDEPDGRYDLLIMDAFSSDSVPVHLLTVEAIADEIRITKPDGIARLPHLQPLLRPGSGDRRRRLGAGPDDPREEPRSRARSGSRARRRRAGSPRRGTRARSKSCAPRAGPPVTPADRPFTDDYADLLRYLYLGL